ncbi:MAG TPA: SDR family oxidoreductase [Myxococcota bacterium]|nr:SDR family oxidoreductase [Myxococcota bacterium]
MSELEDLFSLRGQVALVTGASSGLSAQVARALAKAGANVGLVARRKERLESLAKELEQKGVRACVAPADVTVTDELRAAIDRVETELGPIDILVNGAGIAPLGRAEKHTRAKWDSAVALNLTAVWEGSQLVAQRWIERGRGGRIIQLSSVIGFGANPVHRSVGYAATKGALNNLTRHLAIEWGKFGIYVNALAPSYFPTEMTTDPRTGDVPPDQAAIIHQFTPLGRLGRVEEIDTAVLFLASPKTSYVTGAVVTVDGGWTAW